MVSTTRPHHLDARSVRRWTTQNASTPGSGLAHGTGGRVIRTLSRVAVDMWTRFAISPAEIRRYAKAPSVLVHSTRGNEGSKYCGAACLSNENVR